MKQKNNITIFKHYLLGGYYMKLKTLKRLCTVMCAVVLSSALFAEVSSDANQLVAQQSTKSRSNKTASGSKRCWWKPYFMKLKNTEPTLTSFYQQNVGIGFLYFAGIQGNLQPVNNGIFPKQSRKLQGKLMYNRTPLVEFVVGTDLWRWWKIGLAYQHQGGIVVQTIPQNLVTVPATVVAPADLTSLVRLDAIQFKTYFMFPQVLVWFNVYNEPYLGLAVGPGWQSWVANNDQSSFFTYLRPKFSANCTFTIDLGWKFRKAMPTYVMSFVTGCKFNYWGQARYIGKPSQQWASSAIPVGGGFAVNGQRSAFSNPVRIRSVYQFAPYLGVQFNF